MNLETEPNPSASRDHGGNLSAAIKRFGGPRDAWIDLSTGINPTPYPVTGLSASDWSALPDHTEQQALLQAARAFWNVPEEAAILAAPGASALIAAIPALATPDCVQITPPTYNEHAASFRARGWRISETTPSPARVLVHPNNPDGRLWGAEDATAPLTVIDESFCDVTPEQSLVAHSASKGKIILKSFGKFWGLAGLRLGFAIGDPDLIARLAEWQGPWAVSGPALRIGARALNDTTWAEATRIQLAQASQKLDHLITSKGGTLVGGTDLFRLYDVDDSTVWQNRLAQTKIWSRVFPYSKTYLRLGLPAENHWSRLEAAL